MSNNLSLINGEFKNSISVYDRGLAYGDGFFETMLWDSFKNKFDYEPNTGAAYGYIFADLFIEAIERAGQDLNIDSFVSAMESIVDYVDPLETSTVSFSETSRQGSNVSYFFQVKDERFEVISGPISY